MKSRAWFPVLIAVVAIAGTGTGIAFAYRQGMYATTRAALEKPTELPLMPRASESVPDAAVGATVYMTPFSYQPATVTVSAGEAIRFVNAGEARQWPKSDDAVDAEGFVAPGRSWYAVMTRPGTYAIHDEVYPQVKATIVVR